MKPTRRLTTPTPHSQCNQKLQSFYTSHLGPLRHHQPELQPLASAPASSTRMSRCSHRHRHRGFHLLVQNPTSDSSDGWFFLPLPHQSWIYLLKGFRKSKGWHFRDKIIVPAFSLSHLHAHPSPSPTIQTLTTCKGSVQASPPPGMYTEVDFSCPYTL